MNHAGAPAHLIEIHQVLADLRYPAERWRVIAEAQHYGAGSACMTRLMRLPERTYAGIEEITRELLDKRGSRRDPPTTLQHQHPAA
ncbi:hypothetical protein GCM10023321_08550 [Pseudonocardia eucalypti]|uniref:DUF2795 domain-containing protein n=1 Tax=Pseudonocardia eucalypti TaxID=648755 RepID=A0ABP9PJF0_9PSEU|nr:hypothetical protein [Pseudonocardia eucalypti]